MGVHVKNPLAVAAGKASAAVRWGDGGGWPHKILRLDQLDPDTAEIVRTIVRARRNAAAAAAQAVDASDDKE